MIKYEPVRMSGPTKKRAKDEVVSAIGNSTETDGLVRNDAAKTVKHLLGEKAARMFGDTLEDLRANPQQFSMVFKDKGLRMKALGAISEKARVTDFPTEAATVYEEFAQYMEYCETFFIPPSLGMFAVWCGTNIDDFNKHMKAYRTSRPDVASALEVCKETLRGFLESKAVDGDIAPAVYLHQNKAYFDAVETSTVRHESASDQHVRDSAAIAEVIDLIPEEIKRMATSDE